MPSSVNTAVSGPILGIESSCDETAAAILGPEGCILADVVLSQQREHAPFGGVVPEIAARTHLRYLPDQVGQTLSKAGMTFFDLGGVAATSGAPRNYALVFAPVAVPASAAAPPCRAPRR